MKHNRHLPVLIRFDLRYATLPSADMPRANYESWVQPAKAISFEDDRFVVGCYGDYGRRWLESRLTTMIRRMVECEVGRSVQVEFVLLNPVPVADFIMIRWYFLQHWLPRLGHNAAMFILLLRNLCYFNDETGEIREDVWIADSYETLADRLGLDNPRQVAQWLPPALPRGGQKPERTQATRQEMARREQLQKNIACFVKRLDYRTNSRGSFDWNFQVQRYDPLLPEHEIVKDVAYRMLTAADEAEVLEELLSFFDGLSNDCFETLKKEPMIVLRRSKLSNDCCETLGPILKDCFETLQSLPKDCFETLLKTLKTFKDSRKEKDSFTDQDTAKSADCLENPVGVEAVQHGQWSLERLLQKVSVKKQQALLAQQSGESPVDTVRCIHW